MNDSQKIGFGIIIGSSISILVMLFFFGNDFQVFCCFPALLTGFIMYE